MTEYTVGDLLEQALADMPAPSEDRTDAVLHQAARRRRARTGGAVLGVAAAVAAVVAITTVLPQSTPTTTPPPSASTTAPQPTGSQALTPLEQLVALLPAGIGTVTALPPAAPVAGYVIPKTVGRGAFDGRYLIKKDGRTAFLDIETYDPKARPPQVPRSYHGANCLPGGAPPQDCTTTVLPDGSTLYLWTNPADPDGPKPGQQLGADYASFLTYRDGRVVQIQAVAGLTGPGGYGPGFAVPPLTRAQLQALTENPVWFS